MGCGVNNVRRKANGYTRSTAMCNVGSKQRVRGRRDETRESEAAGADSTKGRRSTKGHARVGKGIGMG
eukprot:4740937-Prymnesium_polylepis.1